ncbi:hypothetical protein ACEQPO_18775 [Bacillus sp. SL00103]
MFTDATDTVISASVLLKKYGFRTWLCRYSHINCRFPAIKVLSFSLYKAAAPILSAIRRRSDYQL